MRVRERKRERGEREKEKRVNKLRGFPFTAAIRFPLLGRPFKEANPKLRLLNLINVLSPTVSVSKMEALCEDPKEM